MTKFLQKFLLIVLLFAGTFSMSLKAADEKFSDEDIAKKMPLLAGSTSAGRDYWFSIPPCYEEAPGANFIRVFCVSPSKNKIICESTGSGYFATRSVPAGGLTVFDLNPVIGQPFLHALGQATPAARIYPAKGVHVYSDNPMVCYVIVRYLYTTDGMLAIPTNGLGKEYVAGPFTSSYWDGLVAWTLVTAAYDNTKVTYTFGGDGVSTVETESKVLDKPGKFVNFVLQKGDVWCVGAMKSTMDIAGSKIVANKPVAVNTGIHCANIPLTVVACDYNCEMEIPTETWGKALLVPFCLNRMKPGIIRIFAKYPNTQVFREGAYLTTIKHGGGPKDDGWIEERGSPLSDPRSPFPCIYTSDKPISIMYYNPGTSDDPIQTNTDPFQMLITPVEQYQSDIMFAAVNAAGGQKIGNNFMNICYELNEFGFMPDDLEFGTWNGSKWVYEKLTNKDGANILFNKNVPIDSKFYGMKNIIVPGNGVFRVRSEKGYKFGCYSYGFDSYDSYGYPTSTALAVLELNDTICPLPIYTKDCDGSVGVLTAATVTDRPDDEAVRSNLSDVYMLTDPDSSYNYIFSVSEIISGQTITANWKLVPIDVFADARAVLVFKDRAGNDTTLTIENFATKLKIYKDQSYGNFKPGDKPVTKDFWLKNESKKVVNVTKLNLLKKNQGFTIEPLTWTLPKTLAIGDSLPIKVTFTPDITLLNSGLFSFVDSIGVGDDCVFGYKVEVRAGIGEPEIAVDDYDFGRVNVDDANPKTKIIRITNGSKSADLAITGYTALHLSEFTTDLATLYPNLSKANPLIIAAGKYKEFTASFKPIKTIKFADTIVFSSDARITDSLCILNGEGIKAALKVNSYDWGEQRIDRTAFPIAATPGKDANGDFVFTLTNSGSMDVVIDQITFTEKTPGDAAEFVLEDKVSRLDKISSYYTSITVPANSTMTKQVYFQPKTTGPHEVAITFGNQSNIDGVICTLKGVGIVPRVMITPIVDFGKTIVNDNLKPVKRDIIIYNPAKTKNIGDWIYGDTVTITSLQINSEISSDITVFGSKGFRYDANNMLDDADKIVKITGLKSYKLLPGDSIRILNAEFVAQAQPSATAEMNVVSDGDDLSYTNSKWTGSGLIQTLATTKEDASTCVGTPVKLNFVISNTGTAPFKISNFALSSANGLSFDTPPPTGMLLMNGFSQTITVLFAPMADIATTSIQLTYDTDIKGQEKQSISFNVEGYSFKGSSASSMHRVSANVILDPAASIKVNEQAGYKITFTGVGAIAKANVKFIDVSINYFGTFLKAVLDLTAKNDPNKYSLSIGKDYIGKFDIDPTTVTETLLSPTTQEHKISFKIIAIGNNVLSNSGELVYLRFSSYLPSYTSANSTDSLPKGPDGKVVYQTTITHTLSDGNNLCFVFDARTSISLKLDPVCSADIRPIVVGSGYYALQAVNPNPVTSAGGTIKFAVGLEGNTEMRIINSAGQAISMPVSSIMKPGEYEVPIPIQDLGSGTYYIEYKSGFFTDTKSLIIQK